MDYLTMKWKMWYKFLDVNNDGKMSTADTEESRNKFTGLHHLVDDKADSPGRIWINGGTRTSFPPLVAMSLKMEFLSRLSASYNKDKTAFKMKMEKCFQVMSNIIDTNKDRSIDLKEFQIAFYAFGFNKPKVIRKAFKEFNDGNMMMRYRDIVSAWVQFVTDEDRSKPDYVQEALKSGV